MEPRISIIVPAYNAEKTIRRCIASVLEQTYPLFELIVINDGSNDSTRTICESFLYDRRVRLVNKVNAGVSAARNTGIDHSTGEYILFLDADDTLPNHACECYIHAMKNNVDLCIADVQRIKEEKTMDGCAISKCISPGLHLRHDLLNHFGNLYQNFYTNSPWGKCYRRDKIHCQFLRNTNIGEDLLFNLSYIKDCEKIMVLEDKLYNYYFQTSNSLTSSFKIESFQTLRYVYEETCTFCNQMDIPEALAAVDEKYVGDMVVLFERFARNEKSLKTPVNMRRIYQIQEMEPVFEKTNINGVVGIKYRFEKMLVQKQQFWCLYLFARFTLMAKLLWRSIRRSNG